MKETISYDWLAQKIVEDSSDAIIFADRAGLIRLWNAGAVRIFGYSADEAIGQSLNVIIPDNLRQRHWDGYYRVMESGESHYSVDLLSAPAMHHDSTRLSTEFSMVLVKDSSERMLGVAAILRDVSIRWQKEKELREKIRVLEAGVEEL